MKKTPYARSGRRERPGRLLIGLAAALLLGAGPATAQEACDERAGTLGIQGMRCEGCTFTMSESGIDQARFRTEPQVIAVVRGFTEGDRLRAGDRIVAIDGALVTTREGSDRLVDLRAGQEVTVRVRRDGRVQDLRTTAGSACALIRQAREREVEIERLPDSELPAAYGGVVLPAPPPVSPDRPAMPPMPAMPAMPPSGYLGFGIQCGPCGLRDGVRFFDNPPTVISIVDDGPAAEAGLREGDVILAVDGHDITEAEGGRRFSEIESGESVELAIRRDDERRTVTLRAGDRAVAPALPALPALPAAPSRVSDALRFEGRLGEVGIEVRGAPVRVTRDEVTGELVIRTTDTVIRLTPGG